MAHRLIADVSIQVQVAAGEAHRVFSDEPPLLRVVPAGAVINQPRRLVQLTAREAIPRQGAAAARPERLVALPLGDTAVLIGSRPTKQKLGGKGLHFDSTLQLQITRILSKHLLPESRISIMALH